MQHLVRQHFFKTFFETIKIYTMNKILITGATGKFGQAVIQALLKNGTPKESVYAMVRNEAKATYLKSLGINIVLGDYDDHDSMMKAFSGIEKLLFVSSGEMQNRTGQHAKVVKAAKKSGVKHIFYTSQIHKTDSPSSAMNFVMKSHLATEIKIVNSGIDYTILRNGLYLDMLPLFLGENFIEKGIFLPAGNGKIAFALREEMAEIAAKIISADNHRNKIYSISGKGVSFVEIAAIISEITAKNITYLSPTYDAFFNLTTNSGMPKRFAKMLGGFAMAAQERELEGDDALMEKLLERKPTTVQDFLERIVNPK